MSKNLIERRDIGNIDKDTRQLCDFSRDLTKSLPKFHGWSLELETGVKSGKYKAISHDPRNYHQSIHFVGGETKFGSDVVLAEINYGDNFHTGDGIPIVVSYTGYEYWEDGRIKIVKYSNAGDRFIFTLEKSINPDGASTELVNENGHWVERQRDVSGKVVKENIR